MDNHIPHRSYVQKTYGASNFGIKRDGIEFWNKERRGSKFKYQYAVNEINLNP